MYAFCTRRAVLSRSASAARWSVAPASDHAIGLLGDRRHGNRLSGKGAAAQRRPLLALLVLALERKAEHAENS
jgi:hypothetical protein